ncbi:pre-rRNA-processing protein TSR4 [Entomortierella parvispora]|uniref:Pre-rRNA-processing protein TSR4 n=1 Tax=Entomortierella parvispora TaxID=205924 RepID=A0A9P3H3I5_9FUNG|nr:pre-rRNA-processing protein TSR4 [Entomortierella parvispora]
MADNDHQEDAPEVMLGFAEPVDLEEHGPLLAEQFVSKIGGLPLWLNPEHILDAKEVICEQCSKPMTFLLQLYSPEDHPEEAFHRAIYVFCCKTGACHKKSLEGCFKVVRSQLGQYNAYYPPVSEKEDNAEEENKGWVPLESNKRAKTCFVCGLHGPKVCSKCHKFSYCSPEHQALHWTKGLHKQLCGTNPPPSHNMDLDTNLAELSIASHDDQTKTLNKEQQEYANKLDIDSKLIERMFRFPELEIISEPEEFDQEALDEGLAHDSSGDEQEAEEGWEEKAAALKAKKEKRAAALAKKNGTGVSKSLESAEASMNALVPVGDELYENTKTDIDAAFLTFQKRVALYPDQVLRYARMEYDVTPEPLYVSDIGIPKTSEIPPCPDCGQERSFEFQVMPQLLNYLAIDHSASDALDFGTLLVYSCKDNCHVEGKHYQHEVIKVQHFSEDGMEGTNMNIGPTASVSSK